MQFELQIWTCYGDESCLLIFPPSACSRNLELIPSKAVLQAAGLGPEAMHSLEIEYVLENKIYPVFGIESDGSMSVI